jgi:hypothetical protein
VENDVNKKLSMKDCTRFGEIAVEMMCSISAKHVPMPDKRLINKEQ